MADPLEVNIISLKQGHRSVVLISADVLYATDGIKERILEVLREENPNLTEANVLFAATHTHYAPAVDASKPRLGPTDSKYLEFFLSQTEKVLHKVLAAEHRPVSICYRYKPIQNHSVNRRRVGWDFNKFVPRKTVAMLPNFSGCNDETVRSVVFKNDTGEIVAMAWNYSCHPTAFPRHYEVSSEFPGKARRAIRVGGGLTIPIVFLQGFSGNIRPITNDITLNLKTFLKKIINGPAVFGTFSEKGYDAWTRSLSEHLLAMFGDGSTTTRPKIDCSHIRIPLEEIIEGARSDSNLFIQNIGLGENLRIIGISAEPVNEYVDLVRSLFPRDEVIPVGCIGSVFGYLPTDKVLTEGGYEAGDFFPAFGLKGRFRRRIEGIILGKIKEVSGPSSK